MARGIDSVMDRIDTLLTDPVIGQRAVNPPLEKWLTRDTDAEEINAQVGPSYVLKWTGDVAFPDLISQPQGSRRAKFALQISVFMGGGEDAGSDYNAAQKSLAVIWQQVVQRLQDPNNLDRTNTGWLISQEFSQDGIEPQGERLMLTGTFEATYDLDYGVL